MTDKNQHDDAEFELFLQGSDELASKLKALGELVDSPGPSAELDATILATIERELEQEASAAYLTPTGAANDPIAPEVAGMQPLSHHSNSWMTRWRVPLGLAAGLFLGVLLHRSLRSEDPLESIARHAEPSKSVSAVAQQMASNSQNIQPPAHLPPIASVDVAKPKPPNGAIPVERKDKSSVSAPVPAAATPAISVAMADKIAQDSYSSQAPAPMVAPAPKVAANEVQRVEITGSIVRRVESEAASPVQVIAADDLAKSPATVSQTPTNVIADERRAERGFVTSAPVVASPSPAITPPSPVALPPSPEVAAVTAPTEIQKSPHEWIVLIEENLKAGRNDEAVKNWVTFRKAYPDYAVRTELMEKIAALQNQQDQK